ncbi:MAG: hypothetical protein A2381_03600 [Bdellovibrionales bacterium RIFOXYB1_FULL_37_110]|nr:MAG: hypothetical protein A2417_14540 [Bdellovibrionales bacterium RIFOXYC1_FULL_37_79]OFZ59122.1 MAG: hypothetical protein A2381_03600 [Bdellovibrionales bacterium RIFOXYB1_FULL_37_110]OFZ64127.1 MAG: hypothetical protein A2577_14630 [Bdellovibrionales bacterium RIFOXYD1_FULL_36_51]
MKKLMVLISLIVFSQNALCETDVVKILQNIVDQSKFLFESGVYEQDKPRIFVLIKSTETSLAKYKAQPIGMNTLNALLDTYSRFKISKRYFDFVRTTFNEVAIDSLYTNVSDLSTALELDESPFLQLIYINLKQISEQFTILTKSSVVSEGLRIDIQEIMPALGTAIAYAKANGDVPSTYAQAEIIYNLINKIEDDLTQELSQSQSLMINYMEIMGVHQFIGSLIEQGREN